VEHGSNNWAFPHKARPPRYSPHVHLPAARSAGARQRQRRRVAPQVPLPQLRPHTRHPLDARRRERARRYAAGAEAQWGAVGLRRRVRHALAGLPGDGREAAKRGKWRVRRGDEGQLQIRLRASA
jgi:hypothetical protein